MWRYFFYLAVSKLAPIVPERLAYGICRTLASFRFLQFKAGRKAIDENMQVILGDEYSPERARGIARKSMVNFSRNVAEIFKLPVLDEKFFASECSVVGAEHIETCLERGKGAIFLSAHIGNGELAVSYYAMRGYDISLIALRHPNPRTDALFVNRRLANGMGTIHTDAAARPALKLLRTNGIIGMLGDRRTAEDGLRVQFFGREAIFPKGPAWLAVASGAGIIPSVCLRNADNTFRIISEPPIFPPEHGTNAEKMLTMTQRFANFVESYVRKYPDQWAIFFPFWGEGPPHLLRAQG